MSSVWEAGEEQELSAGSPISTPSGTQKHTSSSCHFARDQIADNTKVVKQYSFFNTTALLIIGRRHKVAISDEFWGMCNHLYNFYELYIYINFGFHASCYTSDFMFLIHL